MTDNEKDNASVQERLQSTVKNCMDCYEAWKGQAKDVELRQQLEEAVHELRKVTSRIEIELAISDRNNSSLKPMPIPPHRSSKPKPKKLSRENMKRPDNSEQKAAAAAGGDDAPASTDDAPKRGRRPKLKTVQAKGEAEE
jgi:hypothetical protein